MILDTWIPQPVSVNGWPSALVRIFRYTPVQLPPPSPITPRYIEMTHLVRCNTIRKAEGTDPGSASFTLMFGSGDPEAPQDWVQAVSNAVWSPKILEPDDRILVGAYKPGLVGWEWIFDGLCLDWHLSVSGRHVDVGITALGIAHTCWDQPIRHMLMRNADDPDEGRAVPTDLIMQCNPKGRPNCTPDGKDEGKTGAKAYPVFLDPELLGDARESLTFWTVPKLIAHLLYTCNRDETHVLNPTRAELDANLVAKQPKPREESGGIYTRPPYSPSDPSTYDVKQIRCQDNPLNGRDWPNTAHQAVSRHGFSMRWDLSRQQGTDDPQTKVVFFRQQEGTQKQLHLAPLGSDLDMAQSNLANANIQRRLDAVATDWVVTGAPEEYEATIVLQCGFPSHEDDAQDWLAMKHFDKSDSDFLTNKDKYRLWTANLTGKDGHYVPGEAEEPPEGEEPPPEDPPFVNRKREEPFDFNPVFGEPDDPQDTPGFPSDDIPRWVIRHRKALPKLLTLAADGTQQRWKAAISTDYEGDAPAIWDGTGIWQPILHGLELDPHTLAVRVTSQHPNTWEIGPSTDAGHPFPSGVVPAVRCIANPTEAYPVFYIRITVAFQGDRNVKGIAEHEEAAALGRAIVRYIDARDRYKKQIVLKGSEHNAEGTEDIIVRDDTEAALAEAVQAQLITQSGVMDGEITVPYITTDINVGDLITAINGIDLGLRTDNPDAGDAAIYPAVIERKFILHPHQATVLSISDSATTREGVQQPMSRSRPVKTVRKGQ